MLIVTRAARARLLSKLDRRKAAEDVSMRFARKKNGWRLRTDTARPGDTTFTHRGRSVLLVAAGVSRVMQKMRLDVEATERGPRLKLHRNIDSTE